MKDIRQFIIAILALSLSLAVYADDNNVVEWSDTHFESKRVSAGDYATKHHLVYDSLLKHNPHVKDGIQDMWVVRPRNKHKSLNKIKIGGRDGRYKEKCWFFVRPGLTWQGVSKAIGIPVGAIKEFNPGINYVDSVAYAVFIAIPVEVVCKDGNEYHSEKDKVREELIKGIYKRYTAYFVSGMSQEYSDPTGFLRHMSFEEKLEGLNSYLYDKWKKSPQFIAFGNIVLGQDYETKYTAYELSYKLGISTDSLRVIAEKGIYAQTRPNYRSKIFREDLAERFKELDKFFDHPYTVRFSEDYLIYLPVDPNSVPEIQTYMQYMAQEICVISDRHLSMLEAFVKKGQNWKNTAETLSTTRIKLRQANPALNIGDVAEEDCLVLIPFNIIGLGNVSNEEGENISRNYRAKFLAHELDKDIDILEITPEFAKAIEKYDEVSAFYDGRAAVLCDGKWGYIDLNGKEIIPCQYSEESKLKPSRFSNGIACVPDIREEDGEHMNIRVGFIDKYGKWVLRGNFFSEPNGGSSLWNSIYHDLPSVTNGTCSVFDGFYDKPGELGEQLLINMKGETVSGSQEYNYDESTGQEEELKSENGIVLSQSTITGENNSKLVTLKIYNNNAGYSYISLEKKTYYIDNYGNSAPDNVRLEVSKFFDKYVKEEQARQDSIARINFTSPDLAMFNVHGQVKSIKNIGGNIGLVVNEVFDVDGSTAGTSFRFDEEGNCTEDKREPDGEYLLGFKYDNDGKIIGSRFGNDGGYPTHKIEWDKNMRVISESSSYGAHSVERKYKYSDSGDLQSIQYEEIANQGYQLSETIKFTILERDRWGNWTKRKVSISGKETDSFDYETGEPIFKPYSKTRTDRRQIEYYDVK